MINEAQKKLINERLSTELDELNNEQTEKIGQLILRVTDLPDSLDVDYLLDVIDPENPDRPSDGMVQQAAIICISVLSGA